MLIRCEVISNSIGSLATALDVTMSNFISSSSDLPTIAFTFVIPFASQKLLMKSIFLAVESINVNCVSGLAIASITPGIPAPVPMSATVLKFQSMWFRINSESTMCFVMNSCSSVIAVRLNDLLVSTTASIYFCNSAICSADNSMLFFCNVSFGRVF